MADPLRKTVARTLATVAALALHGSLPWPALAQVEVRADERRDAMERVDVERVPLQRHLLSHQQLVVWLPEDWTEAPDNNSEIIGFSRHGERLLAFGRSPTQPGAGLLQVLQETLASLNSNGILEQVESVRRLRLAGRDALEVAGSGGPDTSGARLLLAMDPEREHYRLILLQGAKQPDEPLDVSFKRLLRDWTPLDHGIWTSAFERLRSSMIQDIPSLEWSERNRLFAVMARPAALGQAWIDIQLQERARKDPLLLLDCALHYHPRARIRCLEALEPTALDEPVRTGFYVATLLDPDVAVRFRLARRIAGEHDLVANLLGRLLEVDSEIGRAAAFQLLAVQPEARRAELVLDAFGERRQFPPADQPLLAALLAHWGPASEAENLLSVAWKRSRDEHLEQAVWRELVGLGNQEALSAAQERLAQPLAASALPLIAAATAMAVHARAEDGAESWAGLSASLGGAVDGDAREASDDQETADDIAEARAILDELVDYLETLPVGASIEQECVALQRLRNTKSWARARQERLHCTRRETPLLRAHVPRPGAYAFALLDLVDRLEVGSTVQNQMFHSVVVERLHGLVDEWAGDPITMTSTGVDLESPWELQWWNGGSEGEGSGTTTGGGASVQLRASDPDRLLDTLLRTSEVGLDPESLTLGVAFSNALALLPAGLVAAWTDEQQVVTGTDEGSPPAASSETYVALGVAEPWQEYEHRVLYSLEIEDGSQWRSSHLFRKGADVTLTRAAEPRLHAPEPRAGEPSTESSSASSTRIQVDLAELLRQISEGAPEQLEELDQNLQRIIADHELTLSASTTLEPDSVSTKVEVTGLPMDWLAVARNLSVEEQLRAPRELLPEGCLAWLGVHLDPTVLAERIREGALEPFDELRPRFRQRLWELVEHFDGEAGVAIVGAPDPQSEDVAEAWKSRLVAYLSVDPEAADRFLRRVVRKRVPGATTGLYRLRDLLAARTGRFLVFGTSPETLAALGGPPFYASSATFQHIVARAPAQAMLWAGWDTDLLAEALEASVAARGAGDETTFPIELIRSFGDIVGWFQRDGARVAGELTIHPNLLAEEAQTRISRLAGYGGLNWGSIAAHGLPAAAVGDAASSRIELTLQLPEELPPADLSWENARLQQELVEPGRYRFLSTPAEPLPKESDLSLPITGDQLLPYLRNERNLSIHSAEIEELANSIRGDLTDPARIVRAIVDWAHKELEYRVIEGTESVENILAQRQADCTEFTELTLALARSVGIPARPVSGMFVGRTAAYGHRWAEVFLDRWYEVDPTWGVVQIPATNLRIPIDDINFLGSLPGARFTMQAVDSADGTWVRRLPPGDTPAADPRADVAVEGDRVLVTYALRNEQATRERRVLYSEDSGRHFQDTVAPDGGQLVRLLGGHDKILWLARDGDGEQTLYELSAETLRWRRAAVPNELRGSRLWTLARRPDGYLALAFDPLRLLRLGPDLSTMGSVQLPAPVVSDPKSERGDWVLAREEALLAHSIEGEGITVYPWDGGGWATPVAIADSADLAATDVRRVGTGFQVTSLQRGRELLLSLRVDGDAQTRRSLPPEEAAALAVTTTDERGEWTVWVDARDQLLRRTPID